MASREDWLRGFVRTESLTAATWWADQIRDRVEGADVDNGDPESSTWSNAILQSSSIPPAPRSAAHVECFREFLALRIDDVLSEQPFLNIGVDYGPDQILTDAALAAGLGIPQPGRVDGKRMGPSLMRDLFPWKTNMQISLRDETVTVAAGYAAEWVTLTPRSGSPTPTEQ